MDNVKLRKGNKSLTVEELEKLSKEELIQKLISAEAHNVQLKNVIAKNTKHDDKTKNNRKSFDFSKARFRHVLLKFCYLGWDFQGYVVQEDTTNTVEHYLFEALIKTCLIKDRESSNYHRCGRTDKGVSSFGQVISISLRSKLSKNAENDLKNEINYCKVLNRVLPDNIQCICWCPIPDDYSARFNCKNRTYRYFFPKGNLDIESMKTGLKYLLGVHDFRNFCKMDVGNGVVAFTRNVIQADIHLFSKSNRENPYDMYQLIIKGQAFLWHQIRCIVAILFLIGEGKEKPELVMELLNVDKNTRKPDYNMARDIPLNLFHCEYDVENWFYDYTALSDVISNLQKLWTISSVQTTMMKAMLDDLENTYQEQQFEQNLSFLGLTETLVQGVKCKVYKPVMMRQKCNALEDRIQHFVKKRKLVNVEKDTL